MISMAVAREVGFSGKDTVEVKNRRKNNKEERCAVKFFLS